MKKLMLLIFCTYFCVLCGCNDVSNVIPNTKNLAFTVESNFKNTDYIFYATTDGDGTLSLTVKEPENIENLKLMFLDGSIRLNYLEIEKEIPIENFEGISLFKILYEGFKAEKSLEFDDDEYFSEFKVDNEKFRFYFAESGLPLCIKGENKKIFFKGVTVIK
ncbi:MAG: hypothetical protein IJO62_03970 [Clostridia bacterium]|nr:hypothetical protein [Clostridia bacterium]